MNACNANVLEKIFLKFLCKNLAASENYFHLCIAKQILKQQTCCAFNYIRKQWTGSAQRVTTPVAGHVMLYDKYQNWSAITQAPPERAGFFVDKQNICNQRDNIGVLHARNIIHRRVPGYYPTSLAMVCSLQSRINSIDPYSRTVCTHSVPYVNV